MFNYLCAFYLPVHLHLYLLAISKITLFIQYLLNIYSINNNTLLNIYFLYILYLLKEIFVLLCSHIVKKNKERLENDQ